MEEKDFEPSGLIPRSIIRTVERFRQQLRPETIALGIQEFRISRYQVRVSVRYFFILLLLPIAINWGAKNVIIKPLVSYFWNTYGTSLFLNSYQAERAFKEMRDFESQLFFEMLLSNPRSCPLANTNFKQDQQVLFNTKPNSGQAFKLCNFLQSTNDENPSSPKPSLLTASLEKKEILSVLTVPSLPREHTENLAYSNAQLAFTHSHLLQNRNGQCIASFNPPCLAKTSFYCKECLESKPQQEKYSTIPNSEPSTTQQFVLLPLQRGTKQEKLTQQNKKNCQNCVLKSSSNFCFANDTSQFESNCTINKTKYKQILSGRNPAIWNKEHLNITSSNKNNREFVSWCLSKPCPESPYGLGNEGLYKTITKKSTSFSSATPLLLPVVAQKARSGPEPEVPFVVPFVHSPSLQSRAFGKAQRATTSNSGHGLEKHKEGHQVLHALRRPLSPLGLCRRHASATLSKPCVPSEKAVTSAKSQGRQRATRGNEGLCNAVLARPHPLGNYGHEQQEQIGQEKAQALATSYTLASIEIKTEPNSYGYPFTSAERYNYDFLDRINRSNCFEVLFQEKTYLLAEIYNQQSITALSNMFGDCIMIISIILLLRLNAPQFTILKSFLIESFYSFNDAIKCFYIILITDFLVGFHSPRGWEIVMEMLLRHLGLPENEEFILLFVGTFPVFLDTAFKYWIFRYLNKISPSTVATYHSMIE